MFLAMFQSSWVATVLSINRVFAALPVGLAVVLAALAGALPGGDGAAHAAGIRQVHTNGGMVHLQVTVNKAETLSADDDFSEVLVGNPEIADVVALTSKSLYVLGKQVGSTGISLLGSDKRVMAVINVEVTYDLKAMRAHIAHHAQGGRVNVDSINGKLLLTGSVPDSTTLSRVMAIAEAIAPGAVSNALSVRGSQQVLLEVRFVEANRDSTRDLGVGWQVLGNRFAGATGIPWTSTGAAGTGGVPLIGLIGNNVPFGAAVASLLDGGNTADVIIQALEQRGLARRLAEPNLVALSGDTASFLAGGEFPFPVQARDDRVTIEFKKFGVGLAFTPTVLGDGLINLKIEPEVSELDPNNAIQIANVQIPSLVVRRASTTLELRDGQSFALAGLLQATNFADQREVPWIGQVPVLGTLFKSAAYKRKETDLVIIVTPRLVKPARPGDKLATPHDGRVAANDVEFFLKGQQEIKVDRPPRLSGHILDLYPQEAVGGMKNGSYK
jgi:pilus assembly protein CpaC